eukprot:14403113-Ditylum_brightwellii.AAC.1
MHGVSSIGNVPRSNGFPEDMFINLPVMADLVSMRDRRQELINENLCRQNLKCCEWDYAVGQEVLIKEVDPNKLQQRAHGPYTIVHVFMNGNVAVRQAPYVVERMNIRCLLSFRR